MKALTDAVINNFRKGDQKALRHIFAELYPTLCYFACKYVQDKDEAEDITQEVFIELWNQREKFTGISHIKTFLYISVRNRCLNVLKHQRVIGKYEQEQLSDDVGTIAFEDHLIQAEVTGKIKNAVDSLPEQQKKITLLSIQGLKNHEIAEDLQISVNTVKLQKKIAYRKLREMLGIVFWIMGV